MVANEAGDALLLFTVFTFPSSHYALLAEKICKGAGLPAQLIPLPRELGSECGVSLLLPAEMERQGDHLLKRAGIPVEGAYPLLRKGRQARLWQRYLWERS